ncbi:hypothetical protein JTE90_024621 [Oedothorax gibbosus]|uniref:Nucleoporin Nup133/Nup155-like C-terminal domain-containing protein n=1 Tax=Oedothorax gibbosus TaxID=931172 RepID=A0AAV6UGQ2_9ARAC|nr:hypothetical protein JTE90_024621 [Oedothorax gibbosus]
MDLDRNLKQHFSQALENDSNLIPNVKTWCLDMQICSSGVMIFTAGTLAARLGGTVHYALGVVNSDKSSETFTAFHLTSYNEPYQEDIEERLLHYKFLLPTMDSPSAYIYNATKVLCIPIESTEHHTELDFSTMQDIILGSGSCEGIPLFFTKEYGIVSFTPKQKQFGDPRLLASMKEVSFRQTDPDEPPESISANLRTAMCAFVANDTDKCERLVAEVLSGKPSLDGAVLGLSLGIIDDYPVSDPRWCESIPSGLVSSSLLISYQLEDKLKTHECLVTFLSACHLMELLSTSRDGEVKVATTVLLSEHAEKLNAARALRVFLNDHSDVIGAVIQDTLERRGVSPKNHLTPQDVFFREVSSFHTMFPSLLEWEISQLNAGEGADARLNAIMTTNKIFVGLLQAALEQRQKHQELLKDGADCLPWTAREGNSGIRHYVRTQLQLNVDHSLRLSDSIQVQGALFQQYVELVDLHLASFSQPNSKEIQMEKGRFIPPLLSVGQYERAAALAEKYLDFDTLIQICEETKSGDRLQRYMHQFSEQNFAKFVFKWYCDKGQKGRLFSLRLDERAALGSFLAEHQELRWLYQVQEEKYSQAQDTLRQLALKETEFLNRKKTLLSLSKACVLVSDVPKTTKAMQIEALNTELDLIAHQEALPVSVVESCGIDPRNMRVFLPEELIEMYIAEENSTANAYDFKIALDLLGFVKKPADDPEVGILRMHIWSKAILRDNWDVLDISNSLDSLKETIFFQIIELAFDQGLDLSDFLPPLEELLQAPELRDFQDNPSFKFLLQASYEHLLKGIA